MGDCDVVEEVNSRAEEPRSWWRYSPTQENEAQSGGRQVQQCRWHLPRAERDTRASTLSKAPVRIAIARNSKNARNTANKTPALSILLALTIQVSLACSSDADDHKIEPTSAWPMATNGIQKSNPKKRFRMRNTMESPNPGFPGLGVQLYQNPMLNSRLMCPCVCCSVLRREGSLVF